MAENKAEGKEEEERSGKKRGEEEEQKEEPLPEKKELEESEEVKIEPTGELLKEEFSPEEIKNDSRFGEKDGRNILILVGALLVVLFIALGGFKLYDQFTGANIADVIDVDKLHQMNREGKLDESRGYMYNGYSFVSADGMWWTEKMIFDTLTKIPLHFGPKEVEDILLEGELSEEFNQGEEVYITIDPKVVDKYYSLALSELSFNMVKGIQRRPAGVCIEEHPACEEREIISCENNAENKPLIELSLANETKIEFIGSCIKISGLGYGIVKAANRILYKWYGIMR